MHIVLTCAISTGPHCHYWTGVKQLGSIAVPVAGIGFVSVTNGKAAVAFSP